MNKFTLDSSYHPDQPEHVKSHGHISFQEDVNGYNLYLSLCGRQSDETMPRESLVALRDAINAELGENSFQAEVGDWLLRCFGKKIAFDGQERNHRFLEEALELVQATGCTKQEASNLVDYVFGRDVGEVSQEVGGTMVTLAALCYAIDVDLQAAMMTELARINLPEVLVRIREKQKLKPSMSALPGVYPDRKETDNG